MLKFIILLEPAVDLLAVALVALQMDQAVIVAAFVHLDLPSELKDLFVYPK